MRAAADSITPETRKLATTMATPMAAAAAPSGPRNAQAPATISGPTTTTRRTRWRARVASTSVLIVSRRNLPHPPEPDHRPGDDPDDDEQGGGAEHLVRQEPEQHPGHDRPEEGR